MIFVGLAGWGDHDELYDAFVKPNGKLGVYASYFPVVEVDSSFYAVQKDTTYAKWVQQTPSHFNFIIKAYQGMTGHLRGPHAFADTHSMYQAFLSSIAPVQEAGKLKAVLFQYPPWFDCTRENVQVLRQARERMGSLPVALEFRHQSWFTGDMREKTLDFMKQEGWIHSICDEPQAGVGSVPTILQATDPKLTIVRMHGRNVDGWNQAVAPNWREVRYLYRYSEQELVEWKNNLQQLTSQTEEISFIFNNNSGGDAAGNAMEFMSMLGISVKGPDVRQLDLFDS